MTQTDVSVQPETNIKFNCVRRKNTEEKGKSSPIKARYPPSHVTNSQETMNLKVQKVDPYQFVNKNFTIAVVLPDNFPDISRRTSNLPLKVDVCFDEEISQFDPLDRNYNPNLVDVVSNTNIDRSRRAVVTLRLKEPSANHQNKKFVIRFMALTLEGEINSICGYSVPITVVRFKLKIQEEFSDHGSYIWMKDVGGKDKSIDLQVGIVDTNDTYVMNRRVPLRVALLYASGVLVPQQDILQLSPDSQLLIGQGGFTRIKCRINEVSSRHQGQLFQILISPDYEMPSALADISPARSVPVEVKSKINFSHKRKMQAMGDTSPGGTTNGTSGSAGTSYHNDGDAVEDSKLGILRSAYPNYDAFRARNFDNFTTPVTLPVSTVPMPMNLSVAQLIKPSPFGVAVPIQTSISHPTHPTHSSSILPLSSVLSSTRSEATASGTITSVLTGNSSNGSNPTATSEESTPQGSALTANLTAFAKRKSNDALNEMYHRAFHRGGGTSTGLTPTHAHNESLLPMAPIETGVWGRSSVQAAEALKDLTSWVELVYSSLREMQWTPLGQLHGAVNPETGLPITQEERLLYNMRNPNKLIEGLALGYQERVMAHLTTLDSFITLRALTPKNHIHHDPSPTNQAAMYNHSAAALSVAAASVGAGAGTPLMGPAGGLHLRATDASITADFWDQFHSQSSPRAAHAANTARIASARVTPASVIVGEQVISPQPNNNSFVAQNDVSLSLFEQSSVRLVCMSKTVYAVLGPEKRETLLGFAVFGSAEGKHQFIGFYTVDKEGSIVFQSYADLLSLHPSPSVTTTPATTLSATAEGNTATLPVPHKAFDQPVDPVQQLLRQISAAELYGSVSLLKDPHTGAFDLALLQRHWPQGETERIFILVE